ncbi:toxin-antitoxin system YwqK family antitoxin [Cetobacterium somerae]
MKKIPIVSGFLILLIILTILGGLAYSQRYSLLRYLPSSPEEDYLYKDDYRVHKETGKPFSGRLYYGEGGNREIFSYKNGLLHGMTARYRDGKIIETGYYKDGMQEGRFCFYSEEGMLLNEGHFSRDQFEGVSRQYHSSNGKLAQETNYVNGLLNGTVKQYNEDGVLIMQMEYVDDVPLGQAYQYYDDGRLKFDIYFKPLEDSEDDVGINATYWNENGQATRGIFYADDGTFYPANMVDEDDTNALYGTHREFANFSPEEDAAHTKAMLEEFESLFLDGKTPEIYETELVAYRKVVDVVEDIYADQFYSVKKEYDENDMSIRTIVTHYPTGKRGVVYIHDEEGNQLRTVWYTADLSERIAEVYNYFIDVDGERIVSKYELQEIEFSARGDKEKVTTYHYNKEEGIGFLYRTYEFIPPTPRYDIKTHSDIVVPEHFELVQRTADNKIYKIITMDMDYNLVSVDVLDIDGSTISRIEH